MDIIASIFGVDALLILYVICLLQLYWLRSLQ